MPVYELRNTLTDEIFEKSMKIAEMEQYMEENPHIVKYFGTAPAMIRAALIKPDSGFKEVLRKIHKNTPGSNLSSTTNI